jgi:hypothetical protein
MKLRFIALVALIATIGLSSAFAQDVAPSKASPSFDGSMTAAEYPFIKEYSGMRLGAALSADGKVLDLAIEAPTTGWVSIGLGSLVMDGAYIVMGVDSGDPKVLEQLGKGHSHGAVTGTKLLKSVVKTTAGKTVLQFAVASSDFVKDGKLNLILAYAGTADLRSRHMTRASTTLSVKL